MSTAETYVTVSELAKSLNLSLADMQKYLKAMGVRDRGSEDSFVFSAAEQIRRMVLWQRDLIIWLEQFPPVPEGGPAFKDVLARHESRLRALSVVVDVTEARDMLGKRPFIQVMVIVPDYVAVPGLDEVIEGYPVRRRYMEGYVVADVLPDIPTSNHS